MVDSLVVRRSQLNDNGGYAIDAGAFRFGGSAEVPVPTSTALVVDDTRMLRNNQGGIRVSDLRGGRMLHSTIESVESDGLYLQGSTDTTDHFRILSDTIRGHENYWLSAYDVDSLFVDSTTVLQTQDGYATGFRAAKITNSVFDNIRSGTAFDLDGYLSGAGVLVTNVTMRGDPVCRRCAFGFVFYGVTSSVFGLTATNLYHAVEHMYAPGTVSHSNISDVTVGVYGYDNSGAASRSAVLATTMSNVTIGIENTQGSVVADSLDLTGGVYGVRTFGSPYSPSGVDTVRNSTIRNFDTGVQISDSTAVVLGNTILNSTSYNLRTDGNGSSGDSATVMGNTFSCSPPNLSVTGFYGYGMSYRVDGNTFSGCGQGVNLTSTSVGSAAVRNNVFTMPANSTSPAILIPSPIRAEVVGNDIRGGGYGGAIYVYGYSFQPTPYARVDSNAIHQVTQRAIQFEYTDSVLARGNLIDTVASSVFSNGATGILVFGATNGAARLVDNKIRHVMGQGILIDHSGSALIVMDSNAVSTIDSAGVRISIGQVSMTGNNIRNNLRNGVEFATSGGANDLHGNALQGNGLYAVANLIDANVNADGNWWGAPAGPNTPGADSTFGPVGDAAPLASPPTVPSLSAPLPLHAAVVRAPTYTAPPSTRFVAPASGAPAPVARVVSASSTRVSRPAALPASLGAVRERSEAARAQRDAERARRLNAPRKAGPQ